MPAPTPIQIRYGGDPSALGGLALATGNARRQYADYQNQLAADRSFLRDETNRRAADSRYRNNFNLSLLGMQANERMARDQATALQEASGLPQRQAAQRGGVSAPIARAGQPVTLVPESGPIDGGPQGGGSVTFREGEEGNPRAYFWDEQGQITRSPGGGVPLEQQGGYARAGQQEGITPELRNTLNYIEGLAVDGSLTDDQLNAMRVAARQGLSLQHIQKLADDQRAGSPSSNKTPGQRLSYQAGLSGAKMDAIEGIPDEEDRIIAQLRYLGFHPESVMGRRARGNLVALWGAERAEVDAYVGAGGGQPTVTRRRDLQGESSTNPIPITSPSQLPGLEGLWVRDENERVFRVRRR